MNTTRHFSRLAACSLVVALTGAAPALQAEQTDPPNPYGPGMMGGYGMGHGMGNYWGIGLDLTDEQQAKVNTIQDETRKSHWALMGEMMNQQARLRDLNLAPKRDSAAIDAAYKEVGQLQQKMYNVSVEAHKRMEAVLTKEQQEKLRTCWRKGPGPKK